MFNKFNFKQTFATLVLFALSVQMVSFTVFGQAARFDRTDSTEKQTDQMDEIRQSKIAPDLEEPANEAFHNMRPDGMQRVIIQMKSETPLNENLGDLNEDEREAMFEREVEANKGTKGILVTDVARVGGRVKKTYDNLGLVSAELPLSQINELIKSDNVAYVSPDREVQSFGHVATTTGWDNTGIKDKGDSDPNTWLTGTNGHIVVIDSGIDSSHNLMRWMDAGGQNKVKYNKDFTGEGITGDAYGHGTHVASMFGGDWVLNNAAYEGVADGASIINLRVLNSTGQGTVSNLIAALDWTVANRAGWNIRVVNMSLGTAARDSYRNDPLCLAARRAVNAGIVVVTSAGNNGKDAAGIKQFGSIGSPGIEPSVITVGAANTFGTASRSDDTVASFSSRGPTRGYVTLASGARK